MSLTGTKLNLQDIWDSSLGELEVVLNKANYITWFKGTSLVSIDEKKEEAVVAVPSNFTKSWLEKKYQIKVLSALRKHVNSLRRVSYVVSPGGLNIETKYAKQTSTQVNLVDKNLDINSGLNKNYTFNTFIPGQNSRLAFATAKAVSERPGAIHNPLFIYGDVGLGKTHLIHAIGNEILRKKPKKRVIYLSCEDFCNEFITAIQKRATSAFKKKYREVDVFLVDDIQFLSNKEGTQEEFFHTFNSLYQNNKQIIMTSDRLPRDIPHIESRLSSRFGGGMVADIQIPNIETRQAILKSKVEQKGWQIDDDVIDYIAKNVSSNVRELEGVLNRFMAEIELLNQEPTVELAKSLLTQIINSQNKKTISPQELIEHVCKFYSISSEDILSKKRTRSIVRPRQVAMFLLRKQLKLSFPQIGKVLGGKDHTTIIHGCQTIKNIALADSNLKQEIILVEEKLNQAV